MSRVHFVRRTDVLTHHEGLRLYPSTLQPIQADVQELDATGQHRQGCQLVLWKDQIPQGRQQAEGIVVDGGDGVAGEVNPSQFRWWMLGENIGRNWSIYPSWPHVGCAASITWPILCKGVLTSSPPAPIPDHKKRGQIRSPFKKKPWHSSITFWRALVLW